MAKKLSRSFNERDVEDINQTYKILIKSIQTFFQDKKYREEYYSEDIFLLKSHGEIEQLKIVQLNEVERYTSFDILASIEAMFTIDYYRRCENKLKDDLSREFRKKYKINKRIDFQKDILDTWSNFNPNNRLLNELKTIFQYRHWIAHGRYWRLKINTSKFDFQYLYILCLSIKNSFKFV